MADDEILTIREVASLLKIGEKTTYTMAQSGQLPGFKVRGQWRFRRADIDAWITRNVTGDIDPRIGKTRGKG
jgi:excisionase family DNA binding protein